MADGVWTTNESPAEECTQSVQARLDGDERSQASAQGRAGQKLRGQSKGKQKGLFGVFSEDFLPRLLAHKPPSLLDGSAGGPTWDPLPDAAPGHPQRDFANPADTGSGEKGPSGQFSDPVIPASVADDAEEPAKAAARWADGDPESQCAVSGDGEGDHGHNSGPVNSISQWSSRDHDDVLAVIQRGLIGFKLTKESISLFHNCDELEVCVKLRSKLETRRFTKWSGNSGVEQQLVSEFSRLGFNKVCFFGLCGR